jgi:hypothetical protein
MQIATTTFIAVMGLFCLIKEPAAQESVGQSAGIQIMGRVTWEDDSPVRGAIVSFCSESHGCESHTTRTQEDGWFRAIERGLPGLKLWAITTVYELTSLGQEVKYSGSAKVVTSPDGDVGLANVSVNRNGQSLIVGKITVPNLEKQDQQAVVQVILQRRYLTSFPEIRSTYLVLGNEFRFSVPSGDYIVSAIRATTGATSYINMTGETVTVADGETKRVDLVMFTRFLAIQ